MLVGIVVFVVTYVGLFGYVVIVGYVGLLLQWWLCMLACLHLLAMFVGPLKATEPLIKRGFWLQPK